ncbi:GTP 3',8-cyclase MoaA [Halobacillus aidingensis]|uniref:GTP 3',8-cyclase n=1 Tax=Halobacillus aidingensis TaxID=240303 RepID=A0A1H0QK50_HALAD|nr:GTP 3',8-cyclase MoaA [Halobacillus aidingensis]SDP17445.1 cyclic pyranopterin phosphate synthase [Halobacillus aidingensis]
MKLALEDKFGRPLEDLRISVTDRCNFRCLYCMPKEIFGDDFEFMKKTQLLTFEEIYRLAKIFIECGVKKIRLTGGEPLLRRKLPDLIKMLTSLEGLKDIGLTTNGFLLERYAMELKKAGLQRVNVSLDAINNKTFQSINSVGAQSDRILKGIKKAKEVGLVVKVNMVVKKGMNDGEIIPMAKFFKEMGVTLRYIEFMDVGQSNGWEFKHVVTKKEIFEMLSKEFDLEPVDPDYLGEVAKRYRYKGTDTEVGFITSVSESFCSTCTRGRISADGKFFTCLFAAQGFDLRRLVRADLSDNEIKEHFAPTWRNRRDRYSDERTEETVRNKPRIEMSYIGG